MAARKQLIVTIEKRKRRKRKPELSDQEKRKILKANGFIKQDLRKNPTPAQKGAITRQWNKYGKYFSDNYVARKADKEQLKRFKQSGNFVNNGKVYIDKEGYDKVYLGKNTITRVKKDKYRTKKRKDFIVPNKEFLATLEQKIKENEKVKNNTVLYTLGNGRILQKRVATYEDFQNYLKATFTQQLTEQQTKHMKRLPVSKRKAYKKKILDGNDFVMNNIAIVTIKPKKQTKRKTTHAKQKSRRI